MAEVSPCARSLQPRFGGKPQKNVDQVSFTTSPDEVGVVCALQWLSLAGSFTGWVCGVLPLLRLVSVNRYKYYRAVWIVAHVFSCHAG